MPRTYKRSNGRIQFRKAGGRFRQTTLADVGLGGCEKCGAIFTPYFGDLGPFINPLTFRDRQRVCPSCLGLTIPPPPTGPQYSCEAPAEPGTRHGQEGPRLTVTRDGGYSTGSWRWCGTCAAWVTCVGVLAPICGCGTCKAGWPR